MPLPDELLGYRVTFLSGTGREVAYTVLRQGRSRAMCIEEAQDSFQWERGFHPGEPLNVKVLTEEEKGEQ